MRRSLFVYACLAGAGGCIWVIAELIALVFPSLNDITRLHGLLGTAANPKARLWVLVLCNELPYWVLAVLSGAFIGVRCRRNWMRDAVIFSVYLFTA